MYIGKTETPLMKACLSDQSTEDKVEKLRRKIPVPNTFGEDLSSPMSGKGKHFSTS